jgi:hypothetical protein
MSDKPAGRSPPAASRFRKGESGNPKGRPRREKAPTSSAFEIIVDKSLTVVQDGRQRELSIDEALQYKTYQEAIAGNRSARREVLKMIERRDKAIAERAPKRQPITVLTEWVDPANANEALQILGIAAADPQRAGREYEHLLLEPWAVDAALRRRRGWRLQERELAEARRCTRDRASIRWPKPSGE